MTYGYDWTSPHTENWQRWLGHLAGTHAFGLELGCFEGRSSAWFLQNILTHQDSMLTVVDTFLGTPDHEGHCGIEDPVTEFRFRENTKQWATKIVILKGETFQHLTRINAGAKNHEVFDFIYVDADHRAPNALADAVLAWPLLKRNGVMIFDDYLWTHHAWPEPWRQPKLGIDSWLACYENEYDLLCKESQVAVRKR